MRGRRTETHHEAIPAAAPCGRTCHHARLRRPCRGGQLSEQTDHVRRAVCPGPAPTSWREAWRRPCRRAFRVRRWWWRTSPVRAASSPRRLRPGRLLTAIPCSSRRTPRSRPIRTCSRSCRTIRWATSPPWPRSPAERWCWWCPRPAPTARWQDTRARRRGGRQRQPPRELLPHQPQLHRLDQAVVHAGRQRRDRARPVGEQQADQGLEGEQVVGRSRAPYRAHA